MIIIDSKYKLIYAFLFALIVLIGCDEIEPPVDSTGEVLFSIDGTLGGNPLLIEAGQEKVYLFTSYALNADDVYEFKASFEKTGQCLADCNEALSISVLNDKSGVQFDLDSSIYIGDYPFDTNEIDSLSIYEVQFQAIATGNSTIYPRWNFGDGTTSNGLSPIHVFRTPNAQVKLEVEDLFGQKSMVQSSIDLANGTQCQKDFYATFNPTIGLYEFHLAELQNLNPSITYNWSLNSPNDVKTGFGNTFETDVQTNGIFEVCLDINENDCASQVCKTFNNQNKQLISAATFEASIISSTIIKNIESTLSNVKISNTNDAGEVYSTRKGSQTTQQYFRIIKITPFEKNENNQPTVKVETEVKCNLYNDSGEVLELESNQLIFAIAYPE